MKIAVIGCGSIGRRHITNLIKLGHEVIAWNRSIERRKIVERDLNISVYDDLNELLQQNELNVVFICSPNSLHAEHLSKVLNSGLHVFVEKPVSDTLDGFDKLVKLAESKKLITHVGANMRFHFGPNTVKKYIVEGHIGRPLWACFWGGMHLPDWHPDEDYRKMYSASKKLGGGVVLDFVHELDLIRWMFGDYEQVVAMVGQSGWLDIETEDIADVLMRYPNGLLINLHLDYLQRPFQRGIRVVGEKGWIEWNLISEKVVFFKHESKEYIHYSYPNDYKHNDMYVEQSKYFLSCIEQGVLSDSDLVSGRKALELAIKIKKSSVTNQFMKGESLC
jgi:predicted dehydrogenase